MGERAQDAAIEGLQAQLAVALSRFDEVNAHLPADSPDRYGVSPLFSIYTTLECITEILFAFGVDRKGFQVSNLERQLAVVEEALQTAAQQVHADTGRNFPFIVRGQG